jgi:hypothetical protein
VSGTDEFLNRDDVLGVLKPVAAQYMEALATDPSTPAPDPGEHLRRAGIEPPEGSNLRLIGPTEIPFRGDGAPICPETGHAARPVHCHPWPNCTWICDS